MAIDWNKIRANLNGTAPAVDVSSSGIDWNKIRSRLPATPAPTPTPPHSPNIPVIDQPPVGVGNVIQEAGNIVGNLLKPITSKVAPLFINQPTQKFPVGEGLTPEQRVAAQQVIAKESVPLVGLENKFPEPTSLKGTGQALRLKNKNPQAFSEAFNQIANASLSLGLAAPESIVGKTEGLLKRFLPAAREIAPAAEETAARSLVPEIQKPSTSLLSKLKEYLAPIKGADEESQAIYKRWVSANLAGKEAAQLEAQRLANIPEKAGWQTVLDYERGVPTQYSNEIKQTFDNLFKEANARGLPVAYRQNYVPQMYKNTPAEVQTAVAQYLRDSGVTTPQVTEFVKTGQVEEPIAQRLRLNFGAAGQRVLPDYETAVKYGLTPAYTHPAQLAAAYRENVESVVANKNLVGELVNAGKLVTKRNAQAGFSEPVSLSFSPSGYYAEPKLARALNNLTYNEANLTFPQVIAKKVATTSKYMQEIALSAGFPKTDVNFFSIGQLIKQLTSRVGEAPSSPLGALRGASKDIAAFVRANLDGASIKFFQAKAPILEKMAQSGIDLSGRVGDWRNMYANMVAKPEYRKIFGRGWDELFQKKTFASFMPQLYVNTFEGTYRAALKRGMPEADAVNLAGEVTKRFHGLIDNVARAKTTQDALSAVAFAPKFREGIIGTLWNVGRSVTTQLRNPAFAASRKLAAGMVLTYAGYQYVNKELNGYYTWQNESGREFSLRIPLSNGNVMYVEFMPSFLSLPRNLGSAAVAAGKLDLKTASQRASSLLSMPLQVSGQILANEDYFGREIYKETDAKQDKLTKIAKYLGLRQSHPYMRLIADYIDLKSDKEFKKPITQSLIEAAEFPLKFNTMDRISRQELYDALDKKAQESADAKRRIQPIYDQAQQLVAQGKQAEANSLVRNLSNEDYAIYKLIKASKTRESTTAAEGKIYQTYQHVQELLAQGKRDEANAIVRAMSNEEYHAYELLKKRFAP